MHSPGENNGPKKTFYVRTDHLAMQGGFGGQTGTDKVGKYGKDHFACGSFEFAKPGFYSVEEVLSEFRVVNPSTTHHTDEKIAWMWHRLRCLDDRVVSKRAATVKTTRKVREKENKSVAVQNSRATKRRV